MLDIEATPKIQTFCQLKESPVLLKWGTFSWFCCFSLRSQDRRIKNKVIKTWSELKSIQNISVFIDFASFYYCFIKGFSKIAILLTLILKTFSPNF